MPANSSNPNGGSENLAHQVQQALLPCTRKVHHQQAADPEGVWLVQIISPCCGNADRVRTVGSVCWNNADGVSTRFFLCDLRPRSSAKQLIVALNGYQNMKCHYHMYRLVEGLSTRKLNKTLSNSYSNLRVSVLKRSIRDISLLPGFHGVHGVYSFCARAEGTNACLKLPPRLTPIWNSNLFQLPQFSKRILLR
jgi:hypothetical protein